MPKGVSNPYWGIEDLRSVSADQVVDFANLDLSSKELMKKGGDGFIFNWLYYSTRQIRVVMRKTPRGLQEAKALQEIVRATLAAITRGDPAGVERSLNSVGAFHCQVSAAPVAGQRRKRVRGDTKWRIAWVPEGRQPARQLVLQRLVDTIAFASRIGRCKHCGEYFLSERVRKTPPKFCTPECTSQFHNKRRLASGYFTKQRRIQRARTKREAQPSS